MKNGSERLLLELSEQDRLQQQVRLFISSFKTTDPGPHRKGAAYTSHSVSSGRRLSPPPDGSGTPTSTSFEGRGPPAVPHARPSTERPGRRRGSAPSSAPRVAARYSSRSVLAKNWGQVHYMAAWRPVVPSSVPRPSPPRHERDMGWTFGGVEEVQEVGILDHEAHVPVDRQRRPTRGNLRHGADVIRRTVDRIARMRSSPKLIYEQWAEVDLLCDEVRTRNRRSVLAAAR